VGDGDRVGAPDAPRPAVSSANGAGGLEERVARLEREVEQLRGALERMQGESRRTMAGSSA